MGIKLLIADDHEVVRLGIKSLLADTEIEVVAEAADGEQALAGVEAAKPDVVLLDVRMPGMDGLAALRRLRADHFPLKILMLSSHNEPTYVAQAAALGADGYLLKGIGRADLVRAVQRVAVGESLWDREKLQHLYISLHTPRLSAGTNVSLTPREAEVLRKLAHGLTNPEIGRSLGMAQETVKDHMKSVYRKLGVVGRTQAAVWAVRQAFD